MMQHKWHIGQSVFVVYGDGKATYDATIEKVGRKYGVARWQEEWGGMCEFVLETGRERDDHNKHTNGRGHVVYASRAEYDEERRQRNAVTRLAGIFRTSGYTIRAAELSPACIDAILAVIDEHTRGPVGVGS